MYDNNYNNGPQRPRRQKHKMESWKKGLLIFIIVLLCVIFLGVGCGKVVGNFTGINKHTDDSIAASGKYIGILEVNGVMGEEGGNSPYNQEWLLNKIDKMESDTNNKGIMLSINTPGGSVYEIDELYLKLKEYKDETGRPVYTYMRDMAASGGYYIASCSDKIYANRNTWTGSIGVTVGTFVDASEFLDKMGIKTVTITAGENKAMGSPVEPMSEEQQEIFQGLVDEAYEQFTSIVADGRKMDIDEVKELADGRIYTAKQAVKNGLIDEISTMEDAIKDMEARYELGDCETPVMRYEPEQSLLSSLIGMINPDRKDSTEVEQIMKLMDENNKFTITYLSNIKR